MLDSKRRRLEAKGWKVGTATEFLDLSADEALYVELKVALSRLLRSIRQDSSLTQNQLAKLVESSQSRVAKMEAGDPTVSVDLLVRSLLALGATVKELGRVISQVGASGRSPRTPSGAAPKTRRSSSSRGRSPQKAA